MRGHSVAALHRALLAARQYPRAGIQTSRLKGSLPGLPCTRFLLPAALLRLRKCSLTRQAQNGDLVAWGQSVARFCSFQFPPWFAPVEPIREPSSGVLGRILARPRSD